MSERHAGSAGGAGGPGTFDPRALFEALADARIGYIIVGGLAVAAHGSIRATEDLDICPDPDEANLERLAGLLAELDAVSADADEFDPGELVAHDLEGLRSGGNFRLHTKLGALDVMQHLEPARSWKTLDRSAETRKVFGIEVRVCGVRDLLAMKTAAGRPQDRIDIQDLKAANRDLGP